MNKTTGTSQNGSPVSATSPVSVEDQTPRLFRYYTIAALVALAVVTIVLSIILRQLAVKNLTNRAESQNVALARKFANSTWPQFEPFVDEASDLSPEELLDHPQTARLRQAILEQIDDPSVFVGVTLYDPEGLVVFSTEDTEIGEYRSDADGFVFATQWWYRDDRETTELRHYNTFSAFEGTINDRELVSSYVPIYRDGRTGPIEGVIQVYQDVTPALQGIKRTQRNAIAGVMLALVVLAGLSLFIRRSPRARDRESGA
jgi:hypothetical protein